MIEKLKQYRRFILRKLKLRPIDKVFKKLKEKGYNSFETGLEVFGYNGEYHTMNYQSFVKELHVWEWAADCEEALKQNLPKAKIKIIDSFKEIKETAVKFDLVVVDNHQGIFGDDYCEHFEMLPNVFGVLKDEAIIIFNILPNINELQKMYKGSYSLHKAKRNSWYGKQDSDILSDTFLFDFYTKLCQKYNYTLNFSFIEKRNNVVSYMVVGLKKHT
jgi:hypothetical protein